MSLLAVGAVWREPLSKEISLLLGEKYKIERNNRRRGQVFPFFPGFTRSGQVIWVSEEQAENRRLTGDEQVRNKSVSGCLVSRRGAKAAQGLRRART